ncbi:MAG TPA: hypothetical protein VFB07_04985 [Vicinamibacterales bacterium]|nr:hypothetical protein [Vicinamibacterales bacterium]
MRAEDVAVVTMTWARTPREEATLRSALAVLARHDLPLFVADRDANAPFAAFLRTLPRTVAVRAASTGLVAQVKAAFAAAASAGTRFLLYTEPDKEGFFARHLRSFLARAPDDARTGIVIAARTDAAIDTFPPMQRYTEGIANHLVGNAVGITGDYCYGPFLVERGVAADIEHMSGDLGWGWRPYVFRAAHRRGAGIAHVRDEFCCPVNQRDEDEAERTHRLRQLRDNLLGLIA